jgi:hypothetical protein
MSRSHLSLALLIVVAFALLLVVRERPSAAGPGDAKHTVFLHLSGEGPSAKAWYRGAPPTGVPVQDALDTFSEQGYRVVAVGPASRPSITNVASGGSVFGRDSLPEQFFVVFMEK